MVSVDNGPHPFQLTSGRYGNVLNSRQLCALRGNVLGHSLMDEIAIGKLNQCILLHLSRFYLSDFGTTRWSFHTNQESTHEDPKY